MRPKCCEETNRVASIARFLWLLQVHPLFRHLEFDLLDDRSKPHRSWSCSLRRLWDLQCCPNLPPMMTTKCLRASQQAGPFAISVYGPADVAVGTANFGVLVQDFTTREVLLDPQVGVSVGKANDDTTATLEHQRALPGDENKLAFAAEIDFPSAGSWVVQVAVRRGSESAHVSLPIEVANAEAGSTIPWSYIVIVAVACVLCGVYLRRHKVRRPAALTAPIA